MTHCDGYRASAVAHAGTLATIGIDAELHAPLPDGVGDLITRPEERRHLRLLADDAPEVAWDRLLFSAKESTYKAWFALARSWLDFSEAGRRFTVDPPHRGGSFTARLRKPGPAVDGRVLAGFEGRWLVREGLVLTAVAVHRTPLR